MITTERLVLRDYQIDDWKTAHIYGSIPEFSKYEIWGPSTEEDSKKFISDAIGKANASPRFEYELAVCQAQGGRHIGGCGIRLEGHSSKVAHLGWAINLKFQKQGFATEAAEALLKFGFESLGILVAYATCDSRNIASSRVMEKLGMTKVGCFPGRKAKDGLIDEYRYEIYSL